MSGRPRRTVRPDLIPRYPAPAPAAIPNALNLLGTYAASITRYTENDAGAMTSSPIAVTAGSSAQIVIGSRSREFTASCRESPRHPPVLQRSQVQRRIGRWMKARQCRG